MANLLRTIHPRLHHLLHLVEVEQTIPCGPCNNSHFSILDYAHLIQFSEEGLFLDQIVNRSQVIKEEEEPSIKMAEVEKKVKKVKKVKRTEAEVAVDAEQSSQMPSPIR